MNKRKKKLFSLFGDNDTLHHNPAAGYYNDEFHYNYNE